MKKEVKKCATCEEFRPLDHHLFELYVYCFYLDNTESYESNDSVREINSVSLAKWFKLASALETVDVNLWKFAESGAFYCNYVADIYDSETKHYSTFSTHLTRFIYVSFAMEELACFVFSKYQEECTLKNISKKKCWRKPSMGRGF